MNCHAFEQKLQQLLDERLSPAQDEQLLAHAEKCADCKDLLGAEEALLAVLAVTFPKPAAAWSANVASQVVAQAQAQGGQVNASDRLAGGVQRHVGWWSLGVAGTAAAVALLFLSAGFMFGPRTNAVVTIAEPANPSARPVKEDAGNQLRTQEAAPYAVAALPAELGQAEYQVAVQHWMESVELAQIEEYSPGIRPLRASLGLTFETLRRTFPGYRELRMPQVPTGAFWLPLGETWS